MALFSADEPVFQAIVESLLPLKYHIPELSLIMDGRDDNVSLELKYISFSVLHIQLKMTYIDSHKT
uniref:Uncharacterized protein n=1 Tax=Rhizophagus irregularis (strain DAOM 181602 / DAOM 197198 / MUCL 43194) TaxID=747089 RepID=U9TID1_RHIID